MSVWGRRINQVRSFGKAAVCAAETRQPHISRRPRHFAAALLDRASDIAAVDDARDLEEVVWSVAARLGAADIEGGDKLVLASAVERRFRHQADFRRQFEALQSLGHRPCIE